MTGLYRKLRRNLKICTSAQKAFVLKSNFLDFYLSNIWAFTGLQRNSCLLYISHHNFKWNFSLILKLTGIAKILKVNMKTVESSKIKIRKRLDHRLLPNLPVFPDLFGIPWLLYPWCECLRASLSFCSPRPKRTKIQIAKNKVQFLYFPHSHKNSEHISERGSRILR